MAGECTGLSLFTTSHRNLVQGILGVTGNEFPSAPGTLFLLSLFGWNPQHWEGRGTGSRPAVLLALVQRHLTLIEEESGVLCLSAGRLIADGVKEEQGHFKVAEG